MALTALQRTQAKKHLKIWPNDTVIDSNITGIEDGSVKEAELVAAIALCETRYAAINTAITAGDELVSGGGAEFSYERYSSLRKQWYKDAVCDLARILGAEAPDSGQLSGWRVY